MFVSRTFLLTALTVVFFGHALAAPMPMPLRREIQRRESAPLDTIAIYARQDTNKVPAERATKAPNGVIVDYKRQTSDAGKDTNKVPAERATKAPDGVIVNYKRQASDAGKDTNKVPAERATKAPNGVIVDYKRDGIIPSEIPTRSLNGEVELY